MSRPTSRGTTQRKSSSRTALIRGAGTLSVGGTGRVNRIVNNVLRDNGWARDTENLQGDFERAIQRAER